MSRNERRFINFKISDMALLLKIPGTFFREKIMYAFGIYNKISRIVIFPLIGVMLVSKHDWIYDGR